MVAMGLLKTTYFLTDSVWLGMLGDDALAAAGGAAFGWWMLLLVGEIAGTGTHALVAQAIGGNHSSRVGSLAAQGAWVALFTAILVQACHPLVPLYFDLLGFGPESAEAVLGRSYLGVSLWGALAFTLHGALGGVYRGTGDTRTILWITAVTVAANVVLDPLMIWGIGGAGGMGMDGAAWATVAANVLGAALAWLWLNREQRPHQELPKTETVLRMVEIGLPNSARGIAFSMIYVILGRMITPYGAHQMAALGVGHRIESIPYLTSVGFEVGAATLVGQYVGAGDLQGARRAQRSAVAWCVGLIVPSAVGLYFGAEWLFSWFANSPQTIAAGASYLRIQSAVFVFMALECVYQGGFTGVGRTVPAFWIGATGTAMRIPLAAGLAWGLGWGVEGIWWAIALSTLTKGLAMAFWFERSGLRAPSR